MPSMKAIKRRIASVRNTQQIMKAMNLVAASKVQKNKAKLEAVTPLVDSAKDFIANGVQHPDILENDYYEVRPVNNTAYVVISGERGLCGSFNTNVLKLALSHMEGKSEQVIAVGAKSKEFLTRRGKNITSEYVGVLENVPYGVAAEIAEQLVDMYAEGKIDEVYIVYTNFVNLLSQNPSVAKLLPLESTDSAIEADKIYEPDIHTYLKKAIPIHLASFIYGAMVESTVCEQASRMTSMDAATRNAGEIVDKLTLQFNRQRQSAITQEISEIVGGANAI